MDSRDTLRLGPIGIALNINDSYLDDAAELESRPSTAFWPRSGHANLSSHANERPVLFRYWSPRPTPPRPAVSSARTGPW